MASLSSSATDLQGGGQAAPVINSGKVLSDESVSASVSIQRLPRILSAEDPGRFALITLTLINLLNYTDRYVPSATKQYIETDLHLSDAETSIPLMAFVFVYMIFSPIFSTLADMGFRRTRLIAGGVVIWSIATAAGALAFDFWSLLVSRALVGVGEAAYATIAPALLSDFYPARRRNAVLSIFYLAIPVGSAVGYVIGGEVGGYLGWRYAFLISGAPGLLVAAMCLVIKEPDQGAADDPLERHEFTVGHDHQHASDLMFGLNEAGMDNDSSDDETEAPRDPYDIAFAVESELGGPAITHPNGVHPAPSRRPTVVSGANTILVRPAAGGAEESTAIPVAADSDIEYSVTTGRPRHIPSPPWKESIVMLINNPYYMYSTVGLTFVTFASGGQNNDDKQMRARAPSYARQTACVVASCASPFSFLARSVFFSSGLADWTPSWMNRVHGVPKSTASTLVGILTCIAGIIGTAYGSWLGERAKGVIKQPYLGVAGLNMVVTAVCAWGVMLLPNIYLIGTLVFIAQVAMWR